MAHRPVILCLASYFKGTRFLEACHEAGADVLLLTREKLAHEPWPMHALAERFLMPSLHAQPDITNAVSYLARTREIARIVALDEYDTLTAAALREHLRIPGMGETTARLFRDKLAMRGRAWDQGIKVPRFVHVLHHDTIRAFLKEVPPPWVLKPRSEASAMGIKRIHDEAELWPLLEALGDRQSHFLLEQYLPGTVFHVDGLVAKRRVRFAAVSAYERPPMQVYQDGGVFATRTVADDALAETLREHHRDLVDAFGFVDGVTHAEFIRAEANGKIYFLEVAARVGGAGIDQLVEASTGVNPWDAWAQLEEARAAKRDFHLQPLTQRHAGLIVCLARQEHPDLSAYDTPEVFTTLSKPYHAGLVLCSDDAAHLSTLIADYSRRFAHDFLTSHPPLDQAPE